jgi:hypothetical protein
LIIVEVNLLIDFRRTRQRWNSWTTRRETSFPPSRPDAKSYTNCRKRYAE